MIRAIIIDDELPAINILKHHLKAYTKIDVVCEFTDIDDALLYVKMNDIDVVFLDICMPEKSGVDVLKDIVEIKSSIDIIFVTAYNDYAVDAFELNALDYLVKPVSPMRIEKTVKKIIEKRLKNNSDIEPIDKPLKVYCLGETRILDKNNKQIKFRTSKAEELFLYLINNNGKAISKENIIDILWAGFPKEKALVNLNSTIYSIRKVMAGILGNEGIVYSKGYFSINTEDIYIDFLEFENDIKDILNSKTTDLYKIEKMLDIYKGKYLDNREFLWAVGRQTHFESIYIKVLKIGIEISIKRREYKKAIVYLDEILKVDSYNEEVYEQIITCFIEVGDRLSALKYYEKLKKLLEDELGVKPDKKLVKLIEEKK